MHLNETIAQAMELSRQIELNVLTPAENGEAIEATEKLLNVLKEQRALLEEGGNVVPLKA